MTYHRELARMARHYAIKRSCVKAVTAIVQGNPLTRTELAGHTIANYRYAMTVRVFYIPNDYSLEGISGDCYLREINYGKPLRWNIRNCLLHWVKRKRK